MRELTKEDMALASGGVIFVPHGAYWLGGIIVGWALQNEINSQTSETQCS